MPAIRRLLSNYLPNILDLEPNSSIPQFTTNDETKPPSLYPLSVVSVERRKTVLADDDYLRGARLVEGVSPLRWGFDVSAVSSNVKDTFLMQCEERH
jgi:hypothetical protein